MTKTIAGQGHRRAPQVPYKREKQVDGGRNSRVSSHLPNMQRASQCRRVAQPPHSYTPTAAAPAARHVVLRQTAKENSSRHCSQKKILIGRSETLVRREFLYHHCKERGGGGRRGKGVGGVTGGAAQRRGATGGRTQMQTRTYLSTERLPRHRWMESKHEEEEHVNNRNCTHSACDQRTSWSMASCLQRPGRDARAADRVAVQGRDAAEGRSIELPFGSQRVGWTRPFDHKYGTRAAGYRCMHLLNHPDFVVLGRDRACERWANRSTG